MRIACLESVYMLFLTSPLTFQQRCVVWNFRCVAHCHSVALYMHAKQQQKAAERERERWQLIYLAWTQTHEIIKKTSYIYIHILDLIKINHQKIVNKIWNWRMCKTVDGHILVVVIVFAFFFLRLLVCTKQCVSGTLFELFIFIFHRTTCIILQCCAVKGNAESG